MSLLAVVPAPPKYALQVRVYSYSAWRVAAPVWDQLFCQSACTSFFLSPEWVESWLEVFGEQLRPDILVFEQDGLAVGGCLLVRKTVWRGPVPIRRVYLNTAGEDEADSTCVEYNSLLSLSGWENAVAAALGNLLEAEAWDEIVASGFSSGAGLEAIGRAFPELLQNRIERPSYYIDLAWLRHSGSSFETALGHATRKHLRQYLRMYQSLGELRMETPPDLRAALRMLEELAELHQQAWTKRGYRGAFASARFFAFHRRLISRAFPTGGIQILRVTAAGTTIGVLYNFVSRGKVYFYQSGLRYDRDHHFHPGMVTHAMAVRYCLESGFDEYDFLAGDGQYKRSLSTDSRQLIWAMFRRRNLRYRAVESLRGAKRMLLSVARRRLARVQG